MSYIWDKEEITSIFEAVCGAAADFGGWTAEATAIVRRLCQALDIAPELPEVPHVTVIAICPAALPEPKDASAVTVVDADIAGIKRRTG